MCPQEALRLLLYIALPSDSISGRYVQHLHVVASPNMKCFAVNGRLKMDSPSEATVCAATRAFQTFKKIKLGSGPWYKSYTMQCGEPFVHIFQ